jgi:hypothetical protein
VSQLSLAPRFLLSPGPCSAASTSLVWFSFSGFLSHLVRLALLELMISEFTRRITTQDYKKRQKGVVKLLPLNSLFLGT